MQELFKDKMTDERNNLHKYAMRFGTCMGLFWICKFILFPAGIKIPFLLLLFILMTIAVPFLGYYYARTYRNKICGGTISFFQAWIFTVFMYMFAALLVAVAHYIYFQFIDHGFIIDYYTNLIQELKNVSANEIDNLNQQLDEVIIKFKKLDLSPINITIQLISQNVLYGSILAIPTALFVMKKRSPTITNKKASGTKYSKL